MSDLIITVLSQFIARSYVEYSNLAGSVAIIHANSLILMVAQLVESAYYIHEKEIATQQRVCLSRDEQ